MKFNMARSIFAIALIATVAVTSAAQTPFHPIDVEVAIAEGLAAKTLGFYRLQAPARFSWPPLVGGFTTPFRRVALAAYMAKKRYKTFTSKDVTPDLLEPEVHIFAGAQKTDGLSLANVETIVVMPKGSKDRSRAVHPIRTEVIAEEFRNLFGFTAEGRGMIAVFPLSVLDEANEVHVVFDRRIPGSRGGPSGSCDDCVVPFDLKNVR